MKRDDSPVREIDRLRARIGKMSEVSCRVTASLDLDTVLQEVVDGACSLTDARYGAVGVFDESGRVGEYITSGMTPEQRLRLSDITRYSPPDGFPENYPPMKTFLGAPIRHLGDPVGNIYLTEKSLPRTRYGDGGGEFSEEDEDFLVMFAGLRPQSPSATPCAIRKSDEQGMRWRPRGGACGVVTGGRHGG